MKRKFNDRGVLITVFKRRAIEATVMPFKQAWEDARKARRYLGEEYEFVFRKEIDIEGEQNGSP